MKLLTIALVGYALLPMRACAENYVFLDTISGVKDIANTEIDLDSIAVEGGLRTYWTRWYNRPQGRVTQGHLMVADCATRRRGQFPGYGLLADVPLYSTYAGTGGGAEMDVVCADHKSSKNDSRPRSDVRKPPTPQHGTSSGSGFLVAPGYIVTNDHVIKDCERIFASRGLVRFPATVLAESNRSDLALIQVEGLRVTRAPNVRRNALLGEDVTVAGHPLSGLLSSDIIVTSGQVNALAGIDNDPTLLQISAPIQPGNSGGPVIDKFGNIVGVVVSKLNVSKAEKMTGDMAQNINFAIKPEILRLFLDSVGVAYKDGSTGRRLDNTDIAQAAKTFTVKLECQ